jgi:hypothetical protein
VLALEVKMRWYCAYVSLVLPGRTTKEILTPVSFSNWAAASFAAWPPLPVGSALTTTVLPENFLAADTTSLGTAGTAGRPLVFTVDEAPPPLLLPVPHASKKAAMPLPVASRAPA